MSASITMKPFIGSCFIGIPLVVPLATSMLSFIGIGDQLLSIGIGDQSAMTNSHYLYPQASSSIHPSFYHRHHQPSALFLSV